MELKYETPMIDLNSVVDRPSGIILTSAGGINNNEQILAGVLFPNLEPRH